MRIALLVLALAACGSHHADVHHPFQVRSDVREIEYTYPTGKAATFTVCAGTILVPVNSGVAIAGMNAWAVDPDKNPVTAIACDANGGLFVLRGHDLVHTEPDAAARTIATLPAGDYTLSDGPPGTAWLWGRTDRGSWILAWTDGTSLTQVQSGDQPIRAIADAGSAAVIGAIGKRLVLWRQGASPSVLLTLDAEPDGLAVGPDGSVFVSMPKGVVRIDANHDVVPVASGMHGTLRIRNWTLYVLWNDAARVVRLRPTDAATQLYGPYASDAQIAAAAANLQAAANGQPAP